MIEFKAFKSPHVNILPESFRHYTTFSPNAAQHLKMFESYADPTASMVRCSPTTREQIEEWGSVELRRAKC